MPDRKFSLEKGGGVLAIVSRDAGAVPPDPGESEVDGVTLDQAMRFELALEA